MAKSLSKSKRLQVKYLPVSALIPNPKNPRKHSKKQIRQLAESIKQFDFIVPVLADGDGNIIAGHGRVLAAQEVGMAEVPVLRIEHLTPAQVKAYTIADNKLTENAEWDDVLLAETFRDLDVLEPDFTLDITGFQMGEIDLMINGDTAKQPEPEEPVPPLAKKAVSQPGDIWILGKHRLLCGNALDSESFDTLMQGDKARQVITDPPYNVKVNGHVSGSGKHREFAMASGEMSQQEFTKFLSSSLRLLAAHSVDGAIFHVCMDWRHAEHLLAAGRAVKMELKNICVWCKDNAGMGTFYRSQHEFVFVFKHGSAPHVNNFELGQHGRYRTNVWNYPGAASFSRNTEEGNVLDMHPTVKPVAMIENAIMDCSKRGEIVLDPFMGSGTTLIAAEKAGRICYGMELDPLYVDLAIRRWEKLTGKKAVHTITGKPFAGESTYEEA